MEEGKDMPNVVGDRLKLLRVSAGISQEQLAKVMNVRQASITRWENGKTEPNLSALLRYADAFDVSMDYIFGRTDRVQGVHYSGDGSLELQKSFIHPEVRKFVDELFTKGSAVQREFAEYLRYKYQEYRNGKADDTL